MSGSPDPLYIRARRALLDGLEALESHLDSLVIVGAQAVYLHTGDAELAVAELTTDADIAIAPEFLSREPQIEKLLNEHGFKLQADPGKWMTPDAIQVDLLVPESVAGPGRRGARLPGHGKRSARRTKGIEGALINSRIHKVAALDPSDKRYFHVAVADPAALLIAKIHKIAERISQPDRLAEKDALDMFRLLRAIAMSTIVEGLRRQLGSELAAPVTAEALDLAKELLTKPDHRVPQMAARAAGGLEDPTIVAASLAALMSEVLANVYK